jgi:hypothetical protein
VESRRKQGRPAAKSRVAATAASPPTATDLAQLTAIVDGGGQFMIGTIKPVDGAAVAHDGKQTLAMLRRQPNETLEALLARLDHAVAVARHRGVRVDEINDPSADVTYKL